MNVSLSTRYQLKGIFISLLFFACVYVLRVDLGRFFWIALILLFAATGVYLTCWIAIKALWRR